MEQIPFGENNIPSVGQDVCYFLWKQTLVSSRELTWETRLTHPITVEPTEARRTDTHVTLQLCGFLADTLVQARVHRASLASCDPVTLGGITYQIMMN